MKNLVLLLFAFALIGCGEKKEASNEGLDAGKADTEAINSKSDLSASNGGAPVKKYPEYDYDKLEGIDGYVWPQRSDGHSQTIQDIIFSIFRFSI